jgi:hypothetical protein
LGGTAAAAGADARRALLVSILVMARAPARMVRAARDDLEEAGVSERQPEPANAGQRLPFSTDALTISPL